MDQEPRPRHISDLVSGALGFPSRPLGPHTSVTSDNDIKGKDVKEVWTSSTSHIYSHFKNLSHQPVISLYTRESKSRLDNHDSKRRVEEYLTESGLPYTIVQPTVLMENVPLSKLMGEDEPVHLLPWNPETSFSFLSCRDLGEACSNILLDPGKHVYATYPFVGTPSPLSFTEAGQIISEEIGKEVWIQRKTVEEGVRFFVGMMTKGKPETASWEMKQGPARMFLYYSDKGLIGNANVLEMVLGRKPLGYREWVKANMQEARSE